jgi:hypothetical protein
LFICFPFTNLFLFLFFCFLNLACQNGILETFVRIVPISFSFVPKSFFYFVFFLLIFFLLLFLFLIISTSKWNARTFAPKKIKVNSYFIYSDIFLDLSKTKWLWNSLLGTKSKIMMKFFIYLFYYKTFINILFDSFYFIFILVFVRSFWFRYITRSRSVWSIPKTDHWTSLFGRDYLIIILPLRHDYPLIYYSVFIFEVSWCWFYILSIFK